MNNVDRLSSIGTNVTTLPFSKEEIELYESFKVSYDHKEKPEKFGFSWCGRNFIQLGKMNYVTAIGCTKVAAGKSIFCHLLMAASLCGEIYDQSNPANKLQCLINNCTSMYIDAEMGRSSTYTALLRIKQTCSIYGFDTPYQYKRRTLSFSIEITNAEKIIRALRYYIINYHPDVVYIDNMVFLLNNMYVNDPTSANRIAELDALCRQYNVTIVLVVHGNKAAEDTNLTGTAGTMVMRISAYGLAIQEGETNEPGKFKHVVTQKARQGGIDGLPDLNFHFLPFISGPYESVYPVLGRPPKEATEDTVSYFQHMFGDKETMSRTEMVNQIMKDKRIKNRQAQNTINDAVKTSIIVKIGGEKRDPYKLLIKSAMCNEKE